MKTKSIILFLMFCVMSLSLYAQTKDEVVYGTEVTYSIRDYKGSDYTAVMNFCQDEKTKEYYHTSNYENFSDSCLVFYTGSLEKTKELYKKINEYIISADSALNVEIVDAKNRKFRLFAPEEKRIGTLVRIQEAGSDKWGVISKQHIRNFSRVFPEDE